eukprot:6810259-Ditylum_brightwellii.AAC.1
MSASEEEPMKYNSLIKKSEVIYFKVECTSTSRPKVKEEVASFLACNNKEEYLKMTRKPDIMMM